MTKKQEKELPCPACAAKVTTTIWSSVNVTLNPEAKADLLKGEINLLRCASCGFESPLPVPLLYHDMDNRFMVQYLPAEALEDGSAYKLLTPNGKLDFGIHDASEASPLAQLLPMLMSDFHVVFSMEELVRYVSFRDRLRELKGKGENIVPPAEPTRQASRAPRDLEQLAADERIATQVSPPPIIARLDAFHVYEAGEDDWSWLVDVMVERLWEGVSPLAAEAEQQHRTLTEKMGMPIDEGYIEYLSPEGGRRFVRATVTLQIAETRGPDGYPNALYVATDADLAKAGYVWVGHTRAEGTLEPQALILDLYVVEAHRRKGLGTLLMGVAEQWAGQRGLDRVVLDFEPDDAPARGLYEKLGYEVHTLRMIKTITSDENP